MDKTFKLLVFCIIAYLVYLFMGFQTSYRYSFYKILDAYRLNSFVAYSEYVDVDEVCSNSVNNSFNRLARTKSQAQELSMMKNVKPMLVKMCKDNAERKFKNEKMGTYTDSLSLFLKAYKMSPSGNKVYTEKNISSNKIQLSYCEPKVKDCPYLVFNKKGAKWVVVEIYGDFFE